MTCITARALNFASAVALALGALAAPAPASAQVRALLPTIDEVEALGPTSIDGVWEIREIGERIVILEGHAFAEDGWVHMLLFEIEPEQVVLTNIEELPSGDFVAQDLPLMANVTFEWVDHETLRGTTDGLFPVTYHLDFVSSDGFGSDEPTRPPSHDDDVPRPW